MRLNLYVSTLFCKHHFFPPKADQGAINKVCDSKWQRFARTVVSSLNFDFIPDHVNLTNLQSLGYFKFLYGRSITTKNHQNKLNWMLFWLIILIKFVKVMSCPNQHLIILLDFVLLFATDFADSESFEICEWQIKDRYKRLVTLIYCGKTFKMRHFTSLYFNFTVWYAKKCFKN